MQTALIEVPSGGTVAFGDGTFSFEVDLSLDVDGVTIRGAGMDATTLSFADQTTGAQGMLVTANDFTIDDLAFEDTRGDALKVLGARRRDDPDASASSGRAARWRPTARTASTRCSARTC